MVHEDPTFQTWIEGLHCQHCGSGENEDRLLLCDRCDTAWHTYCVGLDAVPEGEWFCPRCRPAAEQGGRRRRLRRLRDDSPTAVVDVEAEEEGRRVRRRRGSASSRHGRSSAAALVDEDEDEEESEASDDSFIVPDDEEEAAESSGSEEEELDLESGSDEEGLGARARRLASAAGSRRLRRLRRGSRGAPEPPARAASGRPSRSSAGAAHDANGARAQSGRRQSTVIDEDFDEDEDLPLAVRLARAQRRPLRADAHVTPPAARSSALVRRISDRWQDLRDGRVSFEDLRGGSPAAVVDLLTPPRVPSAAAASSRSPPGSARAVPASLRGEDAGGASGAPSFESRLRQEISEARVRGSRLVRGADPARTVAASRAAGRPLGRSPYFAGPPADAAPASTSGGRWRERVTGSGAPTEASAGPAPSTSDRHLNRGGDRSPPPRRDRGATSASSPAWRQRIPDRAAPSPPTAHQSRRSSSSRAGGSPAGRASSSRAGGSPAPRTPSGLGRAIKAALLPHYVHGRLTDGEYREVCRRASRTLRALRWEEAGAEQRHRLEVARAVGAAVSEVRGRVR